MESKASGASAWLLAMLAAVPAVMAAGSDAAASGAHTFRYVPPAGAPTVPVSVTGDFNGWSEFATPLARGSDGSYSAAVTLPPGLQRYKIVYDGEEIADPAADKLLQQDNGFGDVLSGTGVAPVLLAADSTSQPATHYTFRYTPPAGSADAPAQVAGDFNGWSTTATPMTRATDGSYSAEVSVSPGVHQYKFIVNGNWMPDPAGDKSLETDDGHGGKNSGVNVAAQGPGAHTFHYAPPAGSTVGSVYLVGDFNGWSTTANPMQHNADGSYTLTLDLKPGLHTYKLFVDGKWMPDPAADASLDQPDGFGGKNSGIKIDDAPDTAAKPADAAH